MTRTMRRPAGKAGRQNNQASPVGDETNATHGEDGTPRLGEGFDYHCPACERCTARADYKVRTSTGRLGWIAGCPHNECRSDSTAYLRAVAEVVGTTPWELIEDPRPWLAHLTPRRPVRPAEPDSLPSAASIAGWHRNLLARPDALAWLTEVRGVSRYRRAREQIGYAPAGATLGGRLLTEHGGFVLPVFRWGALVGIRKRFWPKVPKDTDGKPIKMAGLSGRDALLYPRLPSSRAVVLAEGELDALVGLGRGVPVVTGTCGDSLPDHLAGAFKGRRVAVAYDTGSHDKAERTVMKLRAAGATEAFAVDLALPRKGDDLTDWFVTYGRTRGELYDLIRREREAAR